MPLLIDRLHPVDYDDRAHGEQFVITFGWEGYSDRVPSEVVVLYKYHGDILVAGTRQKAWESFDEAVEVGKQIADRFVEKYWQD